MQPIAHRVNMDEGSNTSCGMECKITHGPRSAVPSYPVLCLVFLQDWHAIVLPFLFFHHFRESLNWPAFVSSSNTTSSQHPPLPSTQADEGSFNIGSWCSMSASTFYTVGCSMQAEATVGNEQVLHKLIQNSVHFHQRNSEKISMQVLALIHPPGKEKEIGIWLGLSCQVCSAIEQNSANFIFGTKGPYNFSIHHYLQKRFLNYRGPWMSPNSV